MKKYKKWSNSSALSERFLPILEDPSSFTNRDLTSTFLELSLLYNVLRQAKLTTITREPQVFPGNEKLCAFDCEMTTRAPVSNSVIFWVHPDNIVETKITLLQNLRLLSETTGTPQKSPSSTSLYAKYNNDQISSPILNDNGIHDSFKNRCDVTYTTYLDSKKFSSLQTNTEPGQLRSVTSAQNSSSTNVLCSPVGGLRHFCIATLSTEQANLILNSNLDTLSRSVEGLDNLGKMAVSWIGKRHASPVSKIESRRTRFRHSDTSVAPSTPPSSPSSPTPYMNNPHIWVTIDSDIKLSKSATSVLEWPEEDPKDVVEFPYSVLEVRWEGITKPVWVSDLEKSHLVHQVKGFSLYAHSIALYYPESLMAPPKWMSLISQRVDIRKSPKSRIALKRSTSSTAGDLASRVASSTSESDSLITSRTSVDYGSNSDGDQLSGSKPSVADQPQVRYWNEFDDPEDGNEGFFVELQNEDAGDGLFDDDNIEYLMDLGDLFLAKAENLKRTILGFFGVKFPTVRPRTLSTIYEDPEEEEDDYEGEFETYYSNSRHKHHRNNRPWQGDEAGNYASLNSKPRGRSYHDQSAVDQRNYILTILYSICFFISALMTGTLLGVLVGEDLTDVSAGTYVFIVCGLLIALGISILAMCLYLMRADMPSVWHQCLVFATFFTIICMGVGEIMWVFV